MTRGARHDRRNINDTPVSASSSSCSSSKGSSSYTISTSRPEESSKRPRLVRVGQAAILWPGSPQEKQRRVPVRAGRVAGSAGTIVVSGAVVTDAEVVTDGVVDAVRCGRVKFHGVEPVLFWDSTVNACWWASDSVKGLNKFSVY